MPVHICSKRKSWLEVAVSPVAAPCSSRAEAIKVPASFFDSYRGSVVKSPGMWIGLGHREIKGNSTSPLESENRDISVYQVVYLGLKENSVHGGSSVQEGKTLLPCKPILPSSGCMDRIPKI